MSENGAPKAYFWESPVSGWAQVPYNTREVLVESGEWVSPITGYIRVICVGGGQAGSSRQSDSLVRLTIMPGSDTIFGDLKARGGATQTGGAAGEVVTSFMKVEAGETILYTVGSGGAIVDYHTLTEEELAVKCQFYPAATGVTYWADSTHASYQRSGTGGSNMTPYGGGGGGGIWVAANASLVLGAEGGGNGAAGAVGRNTFSLGGAGGQGAIILEYADPKKKD